MHTLKFKGAILSLFLVLNSITPVVAARQIIELEDPGFAAWAASLPQATKDNSKLGFYEGRRCIFAVEPMSGGGDGGGGGCGFNTLGISRANAVVALRNAADREDIRACLAHDIRQAMDEGTLPASMPEGEVLIQELMNMSIDCRTPPYQECEARLESYCRSKDAYIKFIAGFYGQHGMLGHGREDGTTAVDALAILFNLNVYVWQRKQDGKVVDPHILTLVHQPVGGPKDGARVVHMFDVGGHFDRLVERAP